MCGRTSLFIPQPNLEERFDAKIATDADYRPRYNIAPGQPLEVISNEDIDEIDTEDIREALISAGLVAEL